ncbi:MAG: hypothetical protein PVH38_05850 [Gammaproteobacteria bacterium]|jgi:hypothetical protein
MNPGVSACITILLLSLPFCVRAAASDELAEIRRQMETLQQQYESRLKELEARLEQAEALARENRLNLAETDAASSAASPEMPGASNAFNPAISAVLQGSVNSYSINPDDYALPGFQLGDEGGLAAEGLTLDETEITISANVDPYFYGQTTISLADESSGDTEVELEEAFVDPLMLSSGLGMRFGKFYSDIGYLNRFHSHTWDFHDAPLAYSAFLNKQYGDTGLRLDWLAPTDTYLLLGGETFAGDSFPAGSSSRILGNVQSLFVKVGGDIGVSHAWQAGLSRLWVDAHDRQTDVPGDTSDTFNGNSDLLIGDFVWKWSPNGNVTQRYFKVQGEYFYRDESGDVAVESAGNNGLMDYDGRQRGWYAQGVYQFMAHWRAGLRYDRLSADNNFEVINTGGFANNQALIDASGLDNEGQHPQRWTAMLDWSPSEFSRLRLQYEYDESLTSQVDNVWSLQYIMSLGAHGAHEF